jgi:hypothetical protein
MKALIERDGTMVVLTETDTEEYAMTKWYQSACDGEVKLVIEMDESMKNGALVLGPQPLKLMAVKKKK